MYRIEQVDLHVRQAKCFFVIVTQSVGGDLMHVGIASINRGVPNSAQKMILSFLDLLLDG